MAVLELFEEKTHGKKNWTYPTMSIFEKRRSEFRKNRKTELLVSYAKTHQNNHSKLHCINFRVNFEREMAWSRNDHLFRVVSRRLIIQIIYAVIIFEIILKSTAFLKYATLMPRYFAPSIFRNVFFRTIIRVFMESEDSKRYNCEKCNFFCNRHFDWVRHISTLKHTKAEDAANATTSKKSYSCEECDKVYTTRKGLWTHNKRHNSHINDKQTRDDMIIEILKELAVAQHKNADFQQQYTDLQKQMLEQQSMLIELSGKAGSSINTANSYNNNTFNVNMFLNEYCKNAVTIESFIDSIETTRDDVMYLTRHGNKAGMTKIITNALGQLGVTERPIHCTDLKRHTTYIKDSEGWNKEQAQEKLRRLLCNTQHKCLQRAIEILDSDPNYQKNGTPEYEERIKMMSEITSDDGEEQVIRKIQETAQLNREIAASGQGTYGSPNLL